MPLAVIMAAMNSNRKFWLTCGSADWNTGTCEKGIVICSTGIGISIAANKVPGIRCALCGDCFSAKATRFHNNANVLALGALVTGPGLALDIVDLFIDTPFSGEERHCRRIAQLEER